MGARRRRQSLAKENSLDRLRREHDGATVMRACGIGIPRMQARMKDRLRAIRSGMRTKRNTQTACDHLEIDQLALSCGALDLSMAP